MLLAVAPPTSASLLASVTKLLSLALEICGLEMLLNGEEVNIDVEARSETQSLLRRKGYCCDVRPCIWLIVDVSVSVDGERLYFASLGVDLAYQNRRWDFSLA